MAHDKAMTSGTQTSETSQDEKAEKETLQQGKGYEVYLEERRALIESEQLGSQQFDKAILTLSAGALALSLTFIRNIAPDPSGWTLWFLVPAWGLFASSILVTLITFLTSQAACRRQREILEEEYFKTSIEEETPPKNEKGALTDKLNKWSIACFIGGVILLVLFSVFNISQAKAKEAKMTDKENSSQEEDSTKPCPEKGIKPEELKEGIVPPTSPKPPPKGEPKGEKGE